MEGALKVSFSALLLFGFVQSSVLPVEKCTLSDKACMLTAFQKMMPIFAAGMPEYNVEVLDPMKMSDINFDLSGLKFSSPGGIFKGLKAAKIDDVQWNKEKKQFSVNFHMDTDVEGPYKASGKLFHLDVSGDGKLTMTLKNVLIKLTADYEVNKKDGKDYVKPTKFNYEFEVLDNAHYDLSNLFDGDKSRGDVVLKFLNDNWKQVATEFSKPLFDTIFKDIFKSITKFLQKLPIAEIANL